MYSNYIQNVFIYTLFLMGFIAIIQWIIEFTSTKWGDNWTAISTTMFCAFCEIVLIWTADRGQPYTRVLDILIVVYLVAIVRPEIKYGWLALMPVMLIAISRFGIYHKLSGIFFIFAVIGSSIFVTRHDAHIIGDLGRLYLACLPIFLTSVWALVDTEANGTIITIYFISFHVFLIAAAAFSKHLWTNEQDQEELEELVDIDELTQINNFRAFKNDMEQSFAQYQAGQYGYTIFTLDVDHFKQINDTYGHPSGNIVLKRVAKTILQTAKAYSAEARVYRTGGEEFTVIIYDQQLDPLSDARYDATQKALLEFSRYLKRKIGNLRFSFRTGKLENLTFSLGMTAVSDSDQSHLDAYERADQFLYMSKESGRDAITINGTTITE